MLAFTNVATSQSLRPAHYKSKHSSVLDAFLYPGSHAAASHAVTTRTGAAAANAAANDAAASAALDSGGAPVSPVAFEPSDAELQQRRQRQAHAPPSLPAHVDPGLVTIIADDRPGLEVWDQHHNAWAGETTASFFLYLATPEFYDVPFSFS